MTEDQKRKYRQIAKEGSLVISKHAEQRRRLRNITRMEIEGAPLEFRVVEEYPAAYPHPALLLLGIGVEKAFHIAVGFDLNKEVVYIITVYWTDEDHFESDFITRKRRSNGTSKIP